MRAYTVATVALALRVRPKWIDNVLSHHKVRGVSQARQGIPRRLNREAVSVLAVTLRLTAALRVPLGHALAIAETLVATREGEAQRELGRGGRLVFDLGALENEVAALLADAAEIAPIPRRGRPPRVRRS